MDFVYSTAQSIKIDISRGDAITPAAAECELPFIFEKRKIGLRACNMVNELCMCHE